MGDKSTPWERAWRSGRTCTVFRDQTADIYIIYEEREREIVYSEERSALRVHVVSTRYAVYGRLIGAF